jgi:hypothetical protein
MNGLHCEHHTVGITRAKPINRDLNQNSILPILNLMCLESV